MDWTTWINTGVGIVGIIVGIIGWKSLSAATKINNKVKAEGNSTIQQAQTINNGLDSYAVIRLSKDATQEELLRLISEINLASKEDVASAISEGVLPARKKLADLEEKFEAMPRIYTGPTEPQDARNGDIWFDTIK